MGSSGMQWLTSSTSSQETRAELVISLIFPLLQTPSKKISGSFRFSSTTLNRSPPQNSTKFSTYVVCHKVVILIKYQDSLLYGFTVTARYSFRILYNFPKPPSIQHYITCQRIGFKTHYLYHLVAHKIPFNVICYMASFGGDFRVPSY